MKIKLWEKTTAPYYDEKKGPEPYMVPYIIKDSSACVVIAPGGAYIGKSSELEGTLIAEMLNKNGISAFVLDYRVKPYCYPTMLEDVKRAIRKARFLSGEYGYDENKIAVLGFSAGGHLASMALTHFDLGKTDGDDIDRISSRPDLGILCYPVISLGKYTHPETKSCLLGDKINDEALAFELSGENSVKKDTPPCFIWHTAEDGAVAVENSILFANALRAKNIPFELHIFPYGPHGLGLGNGANDPLGHAAQWAPLCVRFIKDYI